MLLLRQSGNLVSASQIVQVTIQPWQLPLGQATVQLPPAPSWAHEDPVAWLQAAAAFQSK